MHCYLREFKAMGGPCKVHLYGADESETALVLDAAEAEVRRLEGKYSRYLPRSLTTAINAAAGIKAVAIDAETSGLLNYADTVWEESGGLFDLTSGVLRKAWPFDADQLPSVAVLERLLAKVGWQRLQRTEHSVFLPEAGMELDFGGCVKEYAADSVVALLRQHAVEHALVDLGGDIATIGSRADGQPWQIGIRSPSNSRQAFASLTLNGQALASSGDYERYIEIDGKRYSHIINPQTGWPVQGLAAVSVSGPQCLVAGSAATLAMLKPQRDALEWLQALGLPWAAVDQEGEPFSSGGRDTTSSSV
jgi:FAD:protein FMN transferase